jgi:hypothetical protein
MEGFYIIELQNNRWYIGYSIDINRAIEDHRSLWSMIHGPIVNIQRIETSRHDLLDVVVFKYMKMYGIDNVRGGSYTYIVLPDHQINYLKTNMCKYDISLKCQKCGRSCHLNDKCFYRFSINGYPVIQ